MKIVKWIADSHGDVSTSGVITDHDLVDIASRVLDKHCSHDIMGEIVFEADDGKVYVGSTEFVIMEANPEYVKDVREQQEKEDT